MHMTALLLSSVLNVVRAPWRRVRDSATKLSEKLSNFKHPAIQANTCYQHMTQLPSILAWNAIVTQVHKKNFSSSISKLSMLCKRRIIRECKNFIISFSSQRSLTIVQVTFSERKYGKWIVLNYLTALDHG